MINYLYTNKQTNKRKNQIVYSENVYLYFVSDMSKLTYISIHMCMHKIMFGVSNSI